MNTSNALYYGLNKDLHHEVKRALLDGADPNTLDMINDPVIIVAAINGWNDVLNIVLKKGIDPNTRGLDGNTSLMIVSYYNNIKGILLLLKHGAKNRLKNKLKQTAFTFAKTDLAVLALKDKLV